MCCYNSSCRPSGFLSWMASWLAFPICPVISAPLAAISVIRSIRSGSACAMTRSALLSPFVIVTMCVAIRTTTDYSHGQAVLHPMPKCCFSECSVSPAEGWSIDPKSKIRFDFPRRPHGHEIYTWRVSNRVAKALVKVFGPQKGSYGGDLPSKEEVGVALAKGRLATRADLSTSPDLVARSPFECQVTLSASTGLPVIPDQCGKLMKRAQVGSLQAIGTDSDFFVLIDPVTHREVARYGDPSR